MTESKHAQAFASEGALQQEKEHARSEIGEQAWGGILKALYAMSAHAFANLRGDALAARHKDEFDHSCDALGPLCIRAPEEDEVASRPVLAPSHHVPKQVEIADFDARERRLWEQTEGIFRPKRTPAGAGTGRVSVVTPTFEKRQNFHKILWSCFEAQEWPDKELIVIETFQNVPSEFLTAKAKEEPR